MRADSDPVVGLQAVTVWSLIVVILQVAIGSLYSAVPPYIGLVTLAWIGMLIHLPVLVSSWMRRKVSLALVPAMMTLAIAVFVFIRFPPLNVVLLLCGLAFYIMGLFQGKATLAGLASVFLLALVVVGLGWGKNYLFFFPMEAAFHHSLHRDTMLHSALASFIGNHLYPSVGLAGTQYFPYNWLADYVIAAMAQSSGQQSYVVICLIYPIVIFTFVLFAVLSLLDLRERRQERNALVAISLVLLGLYPLQWIDSFGIWPESFMQESFLLSLGILLVTIKELFERRPSWWGLPIIFFLAVLAGMAKVSAVFVLAFFVFGVALQRRDWKKSLPLLATVGLAALACYWATKGRTTDLTFGVLQNLRSPLEFAPLELLVNLTPGVLLGLLWWRCRATKQVLSDRVRALQSGTLVAGAAVFALFVLFNIRAGAGYYFLETWRVCAWLTIAVTLSDISATGPQPMAILGNWFARWRSLSKKRLAVVGLTLLMGVACLNLLSQWGALVGKHLALSGSEPALNAVVTSAKSILRGRDSESFSDLGAKILRFLDSWHREELPTLPQNTRDGVVMVEDPQAWKDLLDSRPVEPLYLAGLTGLPVAGLIEDQYLSLTMYGYGEMSRELTDIHDPRQLRERLIQLGYRALYSAEHLNGEFRLRVTD